MRDECNEVHGINDAKMLSAAGYGGEQRILVAADGLWVRLEKSESASYPAGMTPGQARHIARALYHCARLVEQRRATPKPPAGKTA